MFASRYVAYCQKAKMAREGTCRGKIGTATKPLQQDMRLQQLETFGSFTNVCYRNGVDSANEPGS